MTEQNKSKVNLKSSALTIAVLAILMAAQAVLGLLEIHTATIKISLSFIPVVIAARLYGAVGGALVAGVGDILSCIIHPVGAWYPPITLTYALTGVIFGLFLHKSRSFPRVLLSVCITQFIVSLFINTIWISLLMYNSQDTMFIEFYFTKVAMRIWQVVILTVIELALIPPMLKAMDSIRLFRKLSPAMALGTASRKKQVNDSKE